MGWLVIVVAVVAAVPSVAVAQRFGDPPPITSTPDQAPTPPSSSPTAPIVQQTPQATTVYSRRDHVVNRRGPYALFGLYSIKGDTYGLVSLGMPVAPRLPALRVRAEGVIRYDRVDDNKALGWGVTIGAQYDWRLPTGGTNGDLVIAAGGGIDRAEARFKLAAEPFYPSKWEAIDAWALELDGALEYRHRGGFVFRFVPIELGIPLTHPTSSDPRITIMDDGGVGYSLSLAAGYQLR